MQGPNLNSPEQLKAASMDSRKLATLRFSWLTALVIFQSSGCGDGPAQIDRGEKAWEPTAIVDSLGELDSVNHNSGSNEQVSVEQEHLQESNGTLANSNSQMRHRWTAGAGYRQQVESTVHLTVRKANSSGKATIYLQQQDDLLIERVGPGGDVHGKREPKRLVVDVFRTENGRIVQMVRHDTDDPRCEPTLRALIDESFPFSVGRNYQWEVPRSLMLEQAGMFDPNSLLGIVELPSGTAATWTTEPTYVTSSEKIPLQLEWSLDDDRDESVAKDATRIKLLRFTGRGTDVPEIQVEGFLEYSEPLEQVTRARIKHTVPVDWQPGTTGDGELVIISRFQWLPMTRGETIKDVEVEDPMAVALSQSGTELLQNARLRWELTAPRIRQLEVSRVDSVPFEDQAAANQRDYEWFVKQAAAMQQAEAAILEAKEALQLARLAGSKGEALKLDATEFIDKVMSGVSGASQKQPSNKLDAQLTSFSDLFEQARVLEIECNKIFWKLMAHATYGVEEESELQSDMSRARMLVDMSQRLRERSEIALPAETEYQELLNALQSKVEIGIKRATKTE